MHDEITYYGTQHYTHQFSQPGQTRSRSRTTHTVSNHADMGERTKTMSYHGDRGEQIVSFGGRFDWEVLVAVFAFKAFDKHRNPFWMASLSVDFWIHWVKWPRGLQNSQLAT